MNQRANSFDVGSDLLRRSARENVNLINTNSLSNINSYLNPAYAALSGFMPPQQAMQQGTQNINQANQIYQTAGMAPSTSNLDQYLNPYNQNVINSSVNEMARARDMNLDLVGDQAVASGAYGGSRHGITEGQVMGDFQRDVGTLASNLNRDNYNTAVATRQGDLARQLQAGQLTQGVGDRQQQLGLGVSDRSATSYSDAFQGAQADRNQSANLAAMLQGMGNNYYDLGMSATESQAAAGEMQQQLATAILQQGYGQYQEQLQHPYQLIDLFNATLGGDPRRAAGTATQESTPGLFDYLSAALGTLSIGIGD